MGVRLGPNPLSGYSARQRHEDQEMSNKEEWQNDEDDFYVSKSEDKRDAEARQVLGEELVGLSAEQLSRVPMDEMLLEAIKLAQRLHNKREAKRRQLQYIGRLMRGRDVEPMAKALDRIKQRSQEANARFTRLERLRDKVVAEGDKAVGAVVEIYPEADRQQLRQLARQSRKPDGTTNTTAARALFRYLRSLDEAKLAAADETAEFNDWADEANAAQDEQQD